MARKLILAGAALAAFAAPLTIAGTADAATDYKPRIVCVKYPYPSCGWSG